MSPELVDKALQLFIDHANERDALKRSIINRKIAMVMRGWIHITESDSNQVRYNLQRRDVFHLWSAKNVGHAFGLREYSKFLSFKDYIEMPIDLMDDLLEGYGRGAEELVDLKKKAADKAARDAANAAGLDKAEAAALAAAQRGNK